MNMKIKPMLNSQQTIGKPFMTNSIPTYFDKKYRENMDVNDFKDIISESRKIIYGQAGCGKLTNYVI